MSRRGQGRTGSSRAVDWKYTGGVIAVNKLLARSALMHHDNTGHSALKRGP